MEFNFALILYVITFILILIYAVISRKFSYWSRIGLGGPKPSLLTLGNVLQIAGADPLTVELELQRKYGKVYGIYTGLQPTLTITDHDLIKLVLVKDFDKFVNRRPLKTYHELVNDMVFFTEDVNQWKKIRTTISPSFTSGKLRAMHSLMDKCVDKFVERLNSVVKNQNGILDTKRTVFSFTIDVVAATSFGTEVDSSGSSNPIIENALKMFELSPLAALSYLAMPKWFNKLIRVQHVFNVDSFEYFRVISQEIVRQRRLIRAQIVNKDFIDLMINAGVNENELRNLNYDELTADMDKDDISDQAKPSNSTKATLTEKEIISLAIGFFIGGFETSGSTISHIIFELTTNPEVQERLNSELNQALDGVPEKSDEYFEIVNNSIPYLDAVMKESLRKYPPVLRLERQVMVDRYRLSNISLLKNQIVEIPTLAVQHNPEYYPEPDKFNPKRFMPENKHLLVPYTYIPFGQGPRNCLGMRFAYQEIRICLAKLIRKYRFTPSSATPSKLEFTKFKPMLSAVDFEVKIERR